MSLTATMYYIIGVLSLFNFVRIFALLIGADIYDVKQLKAQKRAKKSSTKPLVSVIIPAFNEETGVLRTLKSVIDNSYPNLEIIVVDDGSRDKTAKVVRDYIKSLSGKKMMTYQGRRARSGNLQRRYLRVNKNSRRVVCARQPNSGKGSALNNGIQNYAWGELVMVLDADSLLHPKAIERMVAHFNNPQVMAAAANVKVLPSKSVLGFAQRIEYLISYRMKRSLSAFNMEYIIGGVGSTFRRQAL